MRSVEQVFFLLIPALGVGFLFQAPLLAIQAAMPVRDMATSTATFGLLRTLGGTVGISVGGAIFSSVGFTWCLSFMVLMTHAGPQEAHQPCVRTCQLRYQYFRIESSRYPDTPDHCMYKRVF
jgi:hypothetical protein